MAGVVDRAASDAHILKHVSYLVQIGVILLHHLDVEAISRAARDTALGIEIPSDEGCLLGGCQQQGWREEPTRGLHNPNVALPFPVDPDPTSEPSE